MNPNNPDSKAARARALKMVSEKRPDGSLVNPDGGLVNPDGGLVKDADASFAPKARTAWLPSDRR
jgi:hypothetical protein